MRRALSCLGFLFIVALFLPGALAAAPFGPIDPDDGVVRLLAADPAAPRTLLAVGRHSGDLYRSLDGGVSWIFSSAGLPQIGASRVLAVTPHPRRRGVFYLATNVGRVYRSVDGGKSWTALGQLSQELLSDPVELAVVPGNPDTLLALDSVHAVVLKSTDGGNRWSPVLRGAFGRILSDPNRPTTLFAQNASGLLRSTNAGARWGLLPRIPGEDPDTVVLLGVAATAPTSLYAGGSRGVYRSQNGGVSWRRVAVAGFTESLRLAVDPGVPTRLYLSGPSSSGVAVSRDGGNTWTFRRQSPLAGPVEALVVGGTGLVFAQQEVGVVQRSAPGIDVWQAGSSRGLLESFPTQLAFHPADPDVLYLARGIRTSDERPSFYQIWWSQDRGQSWERWSAPWPQPSPSREYLPVALAADPDHPGRLLAESGDGLFASDPGETSWTRLQTQPATTLVHTAAGWLFGSCGLTLSADGAIPATDVFPCQRPGSPVFENVAQLAVDRDHPARVYAVLVETFGGTHPAPTTGVLIRSEDGGQTWTEIRREPSGAAYLDQIVPDPFRPGAAYLLADALYRSADAGTTWERIAARPGTVLAADPTTPGTLYAASEGQGFLVSRDDGRTFTPENAGLDAVGRRALRSVIVHPSRPGVVYALPVRGGLFVREP